MLSALQHYSYCPRQCALIHQEQTFTDNLFTVRGQLAHQRVDSGESGMEGEIRIERTLPLFSDRYGLVGKADLVEFLADGTPYPVEYKQGKRQKKIHDEVQLAAQALCLEEMSGLPVPEGAIFHHKSRRRRVVKITAKLKAATIVLIEQVRSLLSSDKMPPPVEDVALCRACSLYHVCQPKLVAERSRLSRLRKTLFYSDD